MLLKPTVQANYWVVLDSEITVKDRKSRSSKSEEYYHLSPLEKVIDDTLQLADKLGLSPSSASDDKFLDDLNLYHNAVMTVVAYDLGSAVCDSYCLQL